MLRQVAHIHEYRQTSCDRRPAIAENQRSKIVEQRLFDVVAGTVDPLSRNALCLVGDLADFRIGVIRGTVYGAFEVRSMVTMEAVTPPESATAFCRVRKIRLSLSGKPDAAQRCRTLISTERTLTPSFSLTRNSSVLPAPLN